MNREARYSELEVRLHEILDGVLISVEDFETVDEILTSLRLRHFDQLNVSKVEDFMITAGQTTREFDVVRMEYKNPSTPEINEKSLDEILQFRFKLIFEELLEMTAAMSYEARKTLISQSIDVLGLYDLTQPDRVRPIDFKEKSMIQKVNTALDAIADLEYVVIGSYIALGLTAEQSVSVFDAVHDNNMSKFPRYVNKETTDKDAPSTAFTTAVTPDGRVCYRNEHGKVVKPKSFRDLDLKPLIGTMFRFDDSHLTD